MRACVRACMECPCRPQLGPSSDLEPVAKRKLRRVLANTVITYLHHNGFDICFVMLEGCMPVVPWSDI